MAGGIGVIMNPRAGANARNPGTMARLGLLLGGNGEARPTTDLDDLYRVAEEFKRDRISVLGINGGDGTNHVVLTAFIETYGDEPLPTIAFLRGGTMNTTANALRVRRGSPGRLLARLIEKMDGRLPMDVVERHVLNVNGHYGFLFGAGLIRNYLQEYYDDGGGHPTPLTAVRTLVWGSVSSLVRNDKGARLTARARAQVTCDGTSWPADDYLALAAATIDQIGLGFRPFARVSEAPHHFEALGITCSVAEFIRELPRIRLGKPMHDDKTFEALASELTIEPREAMDYMIDGDLQAGDGRPITIRIGPNLRIVTD